MCRALEELTHTLRVLDTGKFDKDTARVLHLLDVGLSHTETVDTGSQDLVRTVDGAIAFALQDLQHVFVAGIDVDAFVLEFIQEDGDKTGVGIGLFESFAKQGDEVALALLLSLGGQFHGFQESGVLRVARQGIDDVFHRDFQGDVHTTLQVQTQVDFFFLSIAIGELLEAQVVHIHVAHRVQIVRFHLIFQEIQI